MRNGGAGLVELKYDQKVFMVLGGEGKQAKMLIEDDNLVVFESLWHAGPLVHDLQALGIAARVVPMPLYALHYMSRGLDLGLWVIRHDGTITSIKEIVFP
ncbi:MAG: hypothetical protein PVF45_08960 [Anaerolineae bacterium]|jgi:hypothetical protein